MSRYHENVLFQSRDGKWTNAFYVMQDLGNYNDPDYDEEWDVDVDWDNFCWASTACTTQDQARRQWNGANPGGCTSVSYSRATAKEIMKYEEMVWKLRNPELAKKKAQRAIKAAAKKTIIEMGEVPLASTRFEVNYGNVTYTGSLFEDKGWAMMRRSTGSEPVRVFKLSTKEPAENVYSVNIAPQTQYYSGRGYRYGW